jgi:hypothetical protein
MAEELRNDEDGSGNVPRQTRLLLVYLVVNKVLIDTT